MKKQRVLLLFVLFCAALSPLFCGLSSAWAGQEVLARIKVEAGKHARIDTPVSASLDGLLVPLDSGLVLLEVRGEERVPVPSQAEPGISPRLWWILSGKTGAGRERIYELILGDGEPNETSFVEPVMDDTCLKLFPSGGMSPVLAYNHALIPPPEGADELFTRSGFIHPLWSPSGAVLTRIHPPDHVHHLGIWNPYTRTVFEGREVDFWNLKKGQGTVRFAGFATLTKGPVFGGFEAIQEHVDLIAPGGEKAALNEKWNIRVWNAGGADKGWRLLDLTSTLTCAFESPVLLKKYRYGGLGFRARASWSEGNYLTSEGKQRKDGQGTRARWCNVFGPTEKGPAGVVFMSHPQNYEHPEPMRIWSHTDDIFFSFCPIQKTDWKLEPGNQYVLRYRLYVYDGAIDPQEARRLWSDFGCPPAVSVQLDRSPESLGKSAVIREAADKQP